MSNTPAGGEFAKTRWSLITTLKHGSTAGRAALEELCQIYWRPIYGYLRRRGYQESDAQDLAQELFARIVAHHSFEAADPAKGKLRSYLLTAAKNLIAEHEQKARTVRRGGQTQTFSLDVTQDDDQQPQVPSDHRTAEQEFEYQWASQIIDDTMKDLDRLNCDPDRQVYYRKLRGLIAADQEAISYEKLAQEWSVTPSSLRVQVHRLRKKFRELLRIRIADTLADPSMVDEELDYLGKCLRFRP